MATLTSQERNVLRKAVRLLDMRENRGDPNYNEVCEQVLAGVREILLPTERFKIHLPDEYAFDVKVAWYEIGADGVKHLYVKIVDHAEQPPETPATQTEPTTEGA